MPLLIQQMFIEHLLCASACIGCWDTAVKTQSLCPDGVHSGMEATYSPVNSYHNDNWSRLRREDIPVYECV